MGKRFRGCRAKRLYVYSTWSLLYLWSVAAIAMVLVLVLALALALVLVLMLVLQLRRSAVILVPEVKPAWDKHTSAPTPLPSNSLGWVRQG